MTMPVCVGAIDVNAGDTPYAEVARGAPSRAYKENRRDPSLRLHAAGKLGTSLIGGKGWFRGRACCCIFWRRR
jgi:hypothetical protein